MPDISSSPVQGWTKSVTFRLMPHRTLKGADKLTHFFSESGSSDGRFEGDGSGLGGDGSGKGDGSGRSGEKEGINRIHAANVDDLKLRRGHGSGDGDFRQQ